jgi:hypothetical protein
MAIVHNNVQVLTTPTILFRMPATTRYTAVSIQNNHSAAIFVGDSTITASGATAGHSVATGATYQLWLNAGDVVYAISAANTAAGAISILYSGV